MRLGSFIPIVSGLSDDRIHIVSAAGKADEMEKRNENKWKHLTEDDRAKIATLLAEGRKFSQIGRLIIKDPTTIAKEVKARRHKVPAKGRPEHPCMNATACTRKDVCPDRQGGCNRACRSCPWCTRHCKDFMSYAKACCREDKIPYVCNGCEKHIYGRCRRDKYLYGAENAQKQYKTILVESRIGADRTEDEMAVIMEIATPLVDKGQPLSHIYAHHASELPISQRTFYRYVDAGYIGIKNIDLRRVCRYKKRKHEKVRARVLPWLKIGHTYDKFLEFVAANPDMPISELDIVEGKRSDRKKMLTLMRTDLRLMLILLLERKAKECVLAAIDAIEDVVGADMFKEMFPLILTDNDSVFPDPVRLGTNKDGVVRAQVFYCEPNRADQKGALEKNHEFIRYIIPKGKTFENLTAENVRDMMNHINSTARPDLEDKCPMDLALQVFDSETLAKLGMKLIPGDEVCLKPQLIRKTSTI